MLPPTELSVRVLLSAGPGGVWPGRARIWRPGPSAVAGWSAVESRPRPQPRCHRPWPRVRFARPTPATPTSCTVAFPGGVPAPSAPPPPSSSPLCPVARGRSIAVAGSTPPASWRRTRPPYRISSCCATWVLFVFEHSRAFILFFQELTARQVCQLRYVRFPRVATGPAFETEGPAYLWAPEVAQRHQSDYMLRMIFKLRVYRTCFWNLL